MKENIKNAVIEYQCSGCVVGCNAECFESTVGVGCGKHMAGTGMGIGPDMFIFVGLPKGFNRLGKYRNQTPKIFESFDSAEWGYDKFNIPVWKHLNDDGHTLVRGYQPRLNEPFLHIYLENCMDKIDCLEITKSDIDEMD